jgi:hypothetical protein
VHIRISRVEFFQFDEDNSGTVGCGLDIKATRLILFQNFRDIRIFQSYRFNAGISLK